MHTGLDSLPFRGWEQQVRHGSLLLPTPALLGGLPVKVFQMAGKVGGSTKNLQAKPAGASAAFSLNTILCLLPGLTKQDLKALQVAVDVELSRNTPIDTDLFYMVFDVANEKPMSVSKFSNSENGAIWRKNQPVFDNFIAVHILHGGVTKVMVNAVRKFLVNLIIEDMKEQHVPLTLRTICQQLGHIEAIFNRSFPTYIRNGLGHLILTQLGG